MKFQCTFCKPVKSSKNQFDKIFTECREKNHQIIAMLDVKEIRNELTADKNQKRTIYKVKGRVSNYYVESILIDGKPFFLCYSFADGSLLTKSNIDTADAVYQPIEPNQCGYLPYSFTASEITELMNEKISTESVLSDT